MCAEVQPVQRPESLDGAFLARTIAARPGRSPRAVYKRTDKQCRPFPRRRASRPGREEHRSPQPRAHLLGSQPDAGVCAQGRLSMESSRTGNTKCCCQKPRWGRPSEGVTEVGAQGRPGYAHAPVLRRRSSACGPPLRRNAEMPYGQGQAFLGLTGELDSPGLESFLARLPSGPPPYRFRPVGDPQPRKCLCGNTGALREVVFSSSCL